MIKQFGLMVTIAVMLAGCASPLEPAEELAAETSPESPEVVENSVFELELGTCLNDASVPDGADLADIPQVSCEEPHDSELFGIITVDDDTYPGADVLIEKGQSGCQLRFSDFVGIDFRSSALDFHFYYPTPSSWSQGDRTIYCMLVDPGLQVTGSLEGSKR